MKHTVTIYRDDFKPMSDGSSIFDNFISVWLETQARLLEKLIVMDTGDITELEITFISHEPQAYRIKAFSGADEITPK